MPLHPSSCSRQPQTGVRKTPARRGSEIPHSGFSKSRIARTPRAGFGRKRYSLRVPAELPRDAEPTVVGFRFRFAPAGCRDHAKIAAPSG